MESRIQGIVGLSVKPANSLTSRVKGFERNENYAMGTSVFGLANDVSGWQRKLGLKGQYLPVMMEGR